MLLNESFGAKMMKIIRESKQLAESNRIIDYKQGHCPNCGSENLTPIKQEAALDDDGNEYYCHYYHCNDCDTDIVEKFGDEYWESEVVLEESKELKTESTISDTETDEKSEIDEPADGTVQDVVAVVDPDLTSDDYEKVIQKAEETIEETPEGEQPADSQYVGDNIYTCPICGNAFFTDTELGEGDACPVCSEVPEAFIYNGKVESGLTDEDEELMNNLEDEVDNEEEEVPMEDEEEGEEKETEIKKEPVEDKEIPEENEERKPRHESLEKSSLKMESSYSNTFIDSVRNGGYKPLKYCREVGDNSFEEKMSAKELMDIYNNLSNIYSNLYSKGMTDKADKEELYNDIQYWENRLKELHESKERKVEGIIDDLKATSNKASGKDIKDKYEEILRSEGLKDYIKILEYKVPIICKREAEKGNYSVKFNLGESIWESWQDGKCQEVYDIEAACAEAALFGTEYEDDNIDFYTMHMDEIDNFLRNHDDAAFLIEEFEKWAKEQGFKVEEDGDDYVLSWE